MGDAPEKDRLAPVVGEARTPVHERHLAWRMIEMMLSDENTLLNVAINRHKLAQTLTARAFEVVGPLLGAGAFQGLRPLIEQTCQDEAIMMSPLVRSVLVRGESVTALAYLVNAAGYAALTERDEPVLFLLHHGAAWSADCCRRLYRPEFVEQLLVRIGLRITTGESASAVITLADGRRFTEEGWTLSKVQSLGCRLSGDCTPTVVLDRASPVAVGLLSQKRGFVFLRDHLLSALAAKLALALSFLTHIWPTLSEVFADYITVIVPTETDPEHRTRVVRHGASSQWYPGAIFMNDYHRPEISVAELAENLVHEFTHNYLFNLEELHSWYLTERADEVATRTVPSLWSDRRLPFYSFFHSLLVFSMVHDWTIQAVGEWPADDCGSQDYLEAREKRLVQGFAKLHGHWDDFGLGADGPLTPMGQTLIERFILPRVEHL